MNIRLDQTIFYVLDKTIKSYRIYAQNVLRSHGIKITVDQWLVLKSIGDDPELSQKEIAEKVFKDNASITRMIEILVRQGYLSRSFHNLDRRKVSLVLTKQGKLLHEKMLPVVLSYRKEALKELSDNELVSLNEMLEKIIKNCSSTK